MKNTNEQNQTNKTDVKMVDSDTVVESINFKKPYSKEPYDLNASIATFDHELIKKEKEFFENFNKEKYNREYSRVSNIYGTDKTLMKEKKVKKIWEEFKEKEMLDFLSSNRLITLSDILTIGIDKFIYSIGFRKPKHVSTWKNHVVRMGICSHCKDEFVPMMIQQNGGLCKSCAKYYSFDALRIFIEKENNKVREETSELLGYNNLLMNVMVLFVNDDDFRKLFLLDSDFVKKILDEKEKEKEVDKK